MAAYLKAHANKLSVIITKTALLLLQGCENGMTLIADNPFTNKTELVPFEKGIRIDYILFKVVHVV